jgi:hypothetical protein
VPKHHFEDVANQRLLLDQLATKLGIQHHDDWYSISYSTVIESGGRPVIVQYNNSLYKMLKTVYPEYPYHTIYSIGNNTRYPWVSWKFSRVPRGFWSSLQNQRLFLDDMALKMDVKSVDDWYSVTRSKVIQHGGAGLLKHYNGSVAKMLQTVYPEYPEK